MACCSALCDAIVLMVECGVVHIWVVVLVLRIGGDLGLVHRDNNARITAESSTYGGRGVRSAWLAVRLQLERAVGKRHEDEAELCTVGHTLLLQNQIVLQHLDVVNQLHVGSGSACALLELLLETPGRVIDENGMSICRPAAVLNGKSAPCQEMADAKAGAKGKV
eukprot:CAMPEP_0204527252 /NCGR_PEP_ID=MMETSP0661-20131031/8881_1 /ASSEMBLY_ACC=CAM_ASM_000606 /TAXON_ID=109239 /ORGANISM="Alexandrium margalefi, Strain AMGDE01CS-322" /LENGTH=164 /DNA_ID=CAMNT_0051533145 /DNA_START=368 /DNA_END=862 /DNA_ORIENTATION=+